MPEEKIEGIEILEEVEGSSSEEEIEVLEDIDKS